MQNAVMTVGVLALQGGFAKHIQMLKVLGVNVIEVRKPADLARCDGLIIPGGESTTMMYHIGVLDFFQPLLNFAKKHPVFGTCAGLILLSRKVDNDLMRPLCILDIVIERNAFGRQIESHRTQVKLNLGKGYPLASEGFFIRAPRITQLSEDVHVLAHCNNEPVLIQQGHHLGATFHPELTDDTSIHSYFLHLIRTADKNPLFSVD